MWMPFATAQRAKRMGHRVKNEKSIRTGMTDRVRAACRKLSSSYNSGYFSRRDVYYEVDPEPGQEYRSFERTWQDLIDRGEIAKQFDRFYIYNPEAAPTFDVRKKIFRAMHIKGAFCAADIKKLTDADQSYISAVIRKMVKAGDLELTGKKGKFKFFRVKNSKEFYLEKVKN